MGAGDKLHTELRVRNFRPEYIQGTSGSEGYTLYRADVLLGHHVLPIAHRYRDYHRLHTELSRNFPHVHLPPFPPRVIFHNTSPEVIASRTRALLTFLQTALRTPQLLTTLAPFIGVQPQHLADLLVPRNFIELNDPHVLSASFIELHRRFRPPNLMSGMAQEECYAILSHVPTQEHPSTPSTTPQNRFTTVTAQPYHTSKASHCVAEECIPVAYPE